MRELLGWFWERLMDCLPIVVIDEWDWGMLVRGGQIRKVLTSTDGLFGTGLHPRVPLWDDIVTEPRTEQTVDLPVCNVTTKDGKKVSLSGNLTIVVFDPRLLWRGVHDSEVSINRLGAGLLAEYASDYTWKQLRHDRAIVRRALRSKLSKRMKRWGIRVTGVHLTDFVEAQQHNLFGGGITL